MAMDSSSAQPHHQEIVESMLISRKKSSSEEKKAINRGDDVQSPKCPRCDSPNTKFCYYNNYSLSQPRYLCKSCRRYWTKGGTLRNVPVGGGCRKNRRSSSSSSSSPSSSKRSLQLVEDHHHLPIIPSFNINPLSSSPSSYGSRHDLSLPFSCSSLEKQTNGRHLGLIDDHGFPMSTANPNYIPFSSDIFQNMYCMGDGINLGLGINNSGLNQEMGFFGELFNGASTAINTTTMKQEIGSNNNNNNNDMGIIREGDQISRGLWGFPCQSDNYNFGGDGNVDSGAGAGTGRHGNGSWNGIASSSSSSWHELLNTPLM